MAEYSSLKYDFKDGLGTITLSQPKRGNPVERVFCREFRDAVIRLENEKGLRAVLLNAEGENFSFGGDLRAFHENIEVLPEYVREVLADMNIAAARFIRLPVPTVAAVQGYCMGGANPIIACCDFVIAAENASFGAAFAGIGFSCDCASSVSLTARMGAVRAKRFMLCVERLTATEALQTGLIDEIVPSGELDEKAFKTAARFAKGPTVAYAGIKDLFNSANGICIEEQLEMECKVLAKVAGSSDSKEGIVSMVEKRKPVFNGS